MEASSAFRLAPRPFRALGVTGYKEAVKHALGMISPLLRYLGPQPQVQLRSPLIEPGDNRPGTGTILRSLSFCVVLS